MNNFNRQSRGSSSIRSTSTRRPFTRTRSSSNRSDIPRTENTLRHAPSRGFNQSSDRGGFTQSAHAHRGGYQSGRVRGSGERGGLSGGSRPFTHNRSPRGGGGRGGRVQKTFDVSKFINKNPVQQVDAEVFVPKHTFADFGLTSQLVESITKAGLTTPTPIQDEIIPYILNGKDVVGLANTGTGKTAAFLIPLIHAAVKDHTRQTLILTPTRELAIQIEAELRKIGAGFRLYSTTCVGGTNIRPQIYGLKRANHFIIGTPGRVIDLIERGVLKTARIRTVVLDEADRMLDMGFIHDMKKILSGIPPERETLFFSATMSPDITKLVHDFLRDPVTVSVKKQDITSQIEQDIIEYSHVHKFETLTKLLLTPEMKRVLIFGAMKHSVEKLSVQLQQQGIHSDSIHGNKSHSQRQRSLKRFKDGQVRVLVATDVAARGIHVDNITHVINYDLPVSYEDYVHRIGRTGRGVLKGKALTFVEKK